MRDMSDRELTLVTEILEVVAPVLGPAAPSRLIGGAWTRQSWPAWSEPFVGDDLSGLLRQTRLDQILREWAFDGGTGSGVTVAIIDSGLETDHPALQGRVVESVAVDIGDRVKKGQPLASLDLSLLRAALKQSQATLQAGLASVAQNKATVQQTKATLDREEQVFKLSDGKVPSQTELDTARADYARATANVK